MSDLKNIVTKSWFCVLANPETHGYEGTPKEICERLRDEWITGSDTRSGAWVYCVSGRGLHHVHMVLEDKVSMRFSVIKKSYALGMHMEITKGKKSHIESYINKLPPYDETDEKVLFRVIYGDILGAQGKRSDLERIGFMVDEGMSPLEIMRSDFCFRRYEKLIRNACMDKRYRETPVVRDVAVHYIVGASGSGKSYTYAQLCEEYGAEKVYLLSDYTSGGFDRYSGEPILFLDELKDGWSYGQLLTTLDRYRAQIHARFSNIYALWTAVYIATIFPPQDLYNLIVPEHLRKQDPYEQLRRRITDITYCFRDTDGSYRRYTLPMDQYASYPDLIAKAYAAIPLPTD